MPVAKEGLSILLASQRPLARYVSSLGETLNAASHEGLWPSRALRMGAAFGMAAYHETGYYHEVDSRSLLTGAERALELGVPEAYQISYVLDSHLNSLLDIVQEVPDLREHANDSRDQGGYRQVLAIGAGCVRHYLQQAIATE